MLPIGAIHVFDINKLLNTQNVLNVTINNSTLRKISKIILFHIGIELKSKRTVSYKRKSNRIILQ